ncbi:MAG: VTT domain-containing protein [Dehalococcoidia bacterium]|nr:VTT domain-containing protein [Dehalococcoidia bacterium]
MSLWPGPPGDRGDTWIRQHWKQVLSLVLVVSFSVVLVLNRDVVAQFKGYGYLGIFIISVISSATIVVPVPGMIIVAAMGAVLNPWFVGIVSGVGATIGETTGYFLGYGGRAMVRDDLTYQVMVGWMRRWGGWAIFVLALLPNPLFDVAGVVAGILKYPVWKFYIYGAAGRIPKHLFYAFAGNLGLRWLGPL